MLKGVKHGTAANTMLTVFGLGAGFFLGRFLPQWGVPKADDPQMTVTWPGREEERRRNEKVLGWVEELTCRQRIMNAVTEERVRLTGNPRGKRRGER